MQDAGDPIGASGGSAPRGRPGRSEAGLGARQAGALRTTDIAARAAHAACAPGAEADVGDAGGAAREALFARVMDRIHRYFFRLVRDPSESEDLLQETLLLLERSLATGRYDPSRSFNAWLWLKAHGVFVDRCRRRDRRPPLAAGADLDAIEGRGRDLAAEDRTDLGAALAALEHALGSQALECFVLRYESDLSLEEAAAVVGVTRKTVRRRLDDAHAFFARWTATGASWPAAPSARGRGEANASSEASGPLATGGSDAS